MKYQTFQNLPVAWSNQMRAGAEDNRASQGIGKPENGMKLTVGKRRRKNYCNPNLKTGTLENTRIQIIRC